MTWVAVAAAGDLPDGASLCVETAEGPVAVFRVDGRIFALDDTCSHADASLSEGEVGDGCVACPHHGARFDLTTGAARTLPAVSPVRAWEARERGGRIELRQ